jgi:hypothetical protein
LTTNRLNTMNNFRESYEQILNVLKGIEPKSNFLNQIRVPRLSDIELISLAITEEYLSIDSEYQLFRMLPDCLSEKIERSVYNRRKRRLFVFIELLRSKLSFKLVPFENYLIVDSMPLEVCKLSRSSRSKICRESFESAPDKGFCASQGLNYYGYKLHAVCSLQGVFKSFDLTKASVHDIHFLKDIKNNHQDCTIIGDKAYLSVDYQLDLFNSNKIKLQVPMRNNQKDYKTQHYTFKKVRKRIETLFSQLCDQFMIRRNYAKSFNGYKTRLITKITALTVVQYLNHLANRKLNNLKISIY